MIMLRVLISVVATMRYGGMIHQFKNYVLRQDAPRVARVETAISAAREALAAYARFDVTAEELRRAGRHRKCDHGP